MVRIVIDHIIIIIDGKNSSRYSLIPEKSISFISQFILNYIFRFLVLFHKNYISLIGQWHACETTSLMWIDQEKVKGKEIPINNILFIVNDSLKALNLAGLLSFNCVLNILDAIDCVNGKVFVLVL